MLSKRYNIIIGAGGDSTFSDLINSINLLNNIVGYIPIRTGNVLRHALNYPSSITVSTVRIKYGNIHYSNIIYYLLLQKSGYGLIISGGSEMEILS